MHQHINRVIQANEEALYLSKIVWEIRKNHPTMDCKLMYYKIQPQTMGRDKFLEFCRQHGFTQQRKKKRPYTTDSTGVTRFDNLIENLEIRRINQVWSSDITYFEVGERYYFITFIIDCYSRRILGHSVSDRMTTEATTLPSLKSAIKRRESTMIEGIIFHSDGGGQYYDKEFLALTTYYKFNNSMCEYAYQNGVAERLNGIIKNNYIAHWECNNYKDLVKNVDRAVQLYNIEKPHKSLGYKTPIEFEKSIVNLPQQERPTTKESLEVNYTK